MQINTNQSINNNPIDTSKKTNSQSQGLSASRFMEQVDPEIAEIFEQMSVGLDEDTKFKRAMSLSLHLSMGPLFLRFQDGNYPDGMPNDVKASIEYQNEEWDKLQTDKERNIYTLDWMIDHIGHEQSNDPEFKEFLKDIRASYSGEIKSDYKSRDEKNDEDIALQLFKKDLITKGAVKFLYDFNMEKIEEMVQEYKDKLLKDLGENPTAEELEAVEEMVKNFRKELLERLMEADDKNKNSPININRIEFDLMNDMNSNLENLLKDK